MAERVPTEIHGNKKFLRSRRDFKAVYLRTFEEGRLREKVDRALQLLASCTVCPRDCRVDRLRDKSGVCKIGRRARVSSFFPHLGEEDVLRGWRGSGTIFFSWCNLRCVFCQNFETSQTENGVEVSAHELARMMIRLQEMGCHNINFVTPEHVVPQILEALPIAIEEGLSLPLVYNTGAYDSLESLRLMDGIIDVYMPDFKLWESENCRKYLTAADYAPRAREVAKAMHEQVGELVVDEEGVALRGVLVRHLVMPGLLEDTRQIMVYLADALSHDTFVNVMDQYRPAWKAMADPRYADIQRCLHPEELEKAYAYAREAGLWRFDQRWRRFLF